MAEAFDRLRDPCVADAFSPLGGTPLLVVDVTRDAPPADAGIVSALRDLPCPSVALGADRPSRAAAQLLFAFDTLARSHVDLTPVSDTVESHPLAAMTLVQLLRAGGRLDAQSGLVAESLAYAALQAGPEHAAWLAGRPPPGATPPSSGPAVLARREGATLHLTLNRPERHNAYSAEMRDALCEALAVAVADTSVSHIGLHGAGPSFCSGGDLREFGTRPDPATAHAVRSTRSAARLLAAVSDRLEARVHGACVGAGVELPAFARRVVARPDAWFQLPEVGMGLVPGAGGTVSIPRRIGRQRTAWLALSGARIDAATALDWGLVDEIG